MAKKQNSGNEFTASSSPAAARRKDTASARKKHAPANPVSEPLAVSEPLVEEPAALATHSNPAPEQRTPAHAEIAALAYSYWVARGYQDGCPEEDWARAEKELQLLVRAAGA